MKPTICDIEKFLYKVDKSFPVPLSHKQNLGDFALKLAEKATICVVWDGNDICSMVAGYTENTVNNMAYISVVATVDDARGKGYASRLVGEFVQIAEKKNMNAVHLYTDRKNISATKMYLNLGFEEWFADDELRPSDLHLIRYLVGKRG